MEILCAGVLWVGGAVVWCGKSRRGRGGGSRALQVPRADQLAALQDRVGDGVNKPRLTRNYGGRIVLVGTPPPALYSCTK